MCRDMQKKKPNADGVCCRWSKWNRSPISRWRCKHTSILFLRFLISFLQKHPCNRLISKWTAAVAVVVVVENHAKIKARKLLDALTCNEYPFNFLHSTKTNHYYWPISYRLRCIRAKTREKQQPKSAWKTLSTRINRQTKCNEYAWTWTFISSATDGQFKWEWIKREMKSNNNDNRPYSTCAL